MADLKNSEDIAIQRMEMISPLLATGLDPVRLSEMKKRIGEENGLSVRSIGRYLEAYRQKGFDGLRPQIREKAFSGLLPNWEEIMTEAIQLRRELPKRSVQQIITILELEGIAEPGLIKRTTLQDHLVKRGYSSMQMKLYQKPEGATSRRFQKSHRGMLYQGDIKYGPYLPIGKDGTKKQVYLSAFIDDATRFIVHAQFYDNQRVEIIEDSLREAVLRYGKPDTVFVDNGKQYISDWMKRACAKLGIRLSHAKPYHPEAKGKIEAFNKHLDIFLAEAALANPKTLLELNSLLDAWVCEYYHKKAHSSLGGLSPELAFKTDAQPLHYLDATIVREAFIHKEERKADKTGCVSFKGNRYDCGMAAAGQKVEIAFDPFFLDEIEVSLNDRTFKAVPLTIGENCEIREDPVNEVIKPENSRMLTALNKQNITNRTRRATAVSYRGMGGGQ